MVLVTNYVIVTPASEPDLTTLAQVKAELRLTDDLPARDAWLATQITNASLAIQEEIDHVLPRQRVFERIQGTGRTTALLEVTPVIAVEALTNDWDGTIDVEALAAPPASFAISNAEAGLIWIGPMWPDDSPFNRGGLTSEREPQQGPTPWGIRYLGGYLTRGDDVSASGVDVAVDGRLTLPAGQRAPLVSPGDVVRMTGFAAGNNGRYLVTGREDGAIVLDATFDAETAGPAALVEVRTLPSALERACIETVKEWYFAQLRDPAIKSESLGDWSAHYALRSDATAGLLPSHVSVTLEAYARMV